MPDYALIDPITGEQLILPEDKFIQNLMPSIILLRGSEHEHIGIITHRDLVLFAQWCAGATLARLEGEPDLRVSHALGLVDKWLEDEQSVTSKELEATAQATWNIIMDSECANLCSARAAWVVIHAVWTGTWADYAGGILAENARVAGIAYKDQVAWLVEHLRSGK